MKKFLKKEFKRYLKEKKRCAAQYPDWRDDNFNVLDNKFIWGFNSMGDEPSFATWNEAYIYYNRATKKYYLEIDDSLLTFTKDTVAARSVSGRLSEIEKAFRNFVLENSNGIESVKVELPAGCSRVFELEGEDVAELYAKFMIQLYGYNTYYYVKDDRTHENI